MVPSTVSLPKSSSAFYPPISLTLFFSLPFLLEAWQGCNSLMPKSIRGGSCWPKSPRTHSRFSRKNIRISSWAKVNIDPWAPSSGSLISVLAALWLPSSLHALDSHDAAGTCSPALASFLLRFPVAPLLGVICMFCCEQWWWVNLNSRRHTWF